MVSSYVKYYGRLARQSAHSIAKGIALPLFRSEAMRSGAHEMAFPLSTYAPWQADEEFRRAYDSVRRNTLVDVWRCYELWSLVGELREVPGAILEVGVWRGGTGVLMAVRAAALGLQEPVYLCDTWSGVVKTSAVDTYYRDGKHDNASLQTVAALATALGTKNVELLRGVFPEDTADQVAGESFRLCHCDVDVYRSAKDVFDWVWPRLRPGGIVVFDDYGFPACPGVTKFVDEQRSLDDRTVIHNLNGHGLVVKR